MTSKGHKIGQNVAKFRNVKKFGEVEGRSEQQDPEYIGESSPGIELSSPFSNPNTNNALHVHGKAGKRGVSRMTKSSSVSSIQNNNPDFQGVDHDDIIGLTQDVKAFSDGLAKLKIVITEPTAVGEDARVMSHECLGDVLCILKNILQQYPALQSTDIFSASGSLITHIKNYNYDESDAIMYQALCDAIDQLALAFSSSVSEYLMGDLENIHEKEIKTKSYDNLITASKDAEDEMDFRQNEVQLKPEEIDGTLLKLQAGVDLALQRAKAWSKYMKDLVSYIERKAQHETEYAKNLSRLAQSMRPVLTEEGFLPLQSVYCTVLAQDMEYASTCLAIQTVLETTQFVEPLTARRIEHDKVKRTVKDTWMKEVKRMQDAMQNLRKAQTLYVTRQQEYEKAREQFQKSESDMAAHTTSTSTAAKVDKRKKVEEEAMHKAAEAETTYKACVADANNRQQELGKVKAEILAKIREQIFLCDQVIQTVTVDYFHLLQTVAAPIPVQYHALCDSSKLYEPGTQFGEFVRRLPVSSIGTVNNEPFTFEAYIQRDTDERKPSIHSNGSANSDHPSRESSPQLKHRKDKYRVKAWGQGVQGFFLGSDTDSASGSSKSLDSSPSNSPHPVGQRRELIAGSSDLLGVEESVEGVDVSSSVKQLLSPHSTDSTDASGLLKMEHCRAAVPPIITKCSREIERKGLLLEGIYRVSGVKSKVEGLCKRFEKNPDAVDLTEEHPNVISNVLKLYLRELPVPLLTFRLYPSFIQIAKENIFDPSETTQKLQKLVVQLPFSNQKTCGVLMHHLQRVVSRCEFNLMNAQNLGIVFGPTLLRPLEGTDYLASLDDTPHQTRAVELLIINAENLFGKCEDNELFPGETPVEKLTHTENNQPPQSQSQQPKEPQESQQVTKSPQVSRPSASKSPQIQSSQDIKAQVTKMHDPAKGTSRHSSSSSSVSDRAVEQLIQSGPQASSEANRQQKKVTGDSFVLPGSTHTDKKDTSSLGGTAVSSQDDQEEVIDLDDFQSDDDDLLLPDGSNCQHAMGSSVVSCHKGTSSSRLRKNCNGVAHGKSSNVSVDCTRPTTLPSAVPALPVPIIKVDSATPPAENEDVDINTFILSSYESKNVDSNIIRKGNTKDIEKKTAVSTVSPISTAVTSVSMTKPASPAVKSGKPQLISSPGIMQSTKSNQISSSAVQKSSSPLLPRSSGHFDDDNLPRSQKLPSPLLPRSSGHHDFPSAQKSSSPLLPRSSGHHELPSAQKLTSPLLPRSSGHRELPNAQKLTSPLLPNSSAQTEHHDVSSAQKSSSLLLPRSSGHRELPNAQKLTSPLLPNSSAQTEHHDVSSAQKSSSPLLPRSSGHRELPSAQKLTSPLLPNSSAQTEHHDVSSTQKSSSLLLPRSSGHHELPSAQKLTSPLLPNSSAQTEHHDVSSTQKSSSPLLPRSSGHHELPSAQKLTSPLLPKSSAQTEHHDVSSVQKSSSPLLPRSSGHRELPSGRKLTSPLLPKSSGYADHHDVSSAQKLFSPLQPKSSGHHDLQSSQKSSSPLLPRSIGHHDLQSLQKPAGPQTSQSVTHVSTSAMERLPSSPLMSRPNSLLGSKSVDLVSSRVPRPTSSPLLSRGSTADIPSAHDIPAQREAEHLPKPHDPSESQQPSPSHQVKQGVLSMQSSSVDIGTSCSTSCSTTWPSFIGPLQMPIISRAAKRVSPESRLTSMATSVGQESSSTDSLKTVMSTREQNLSTRVGNSTAMNKPAEPSGRMGQALKDQVIIQSDPDLKDFSHPETSDVQVESSSHDPVPVVSYALEKEINPTLPTSKVATISNSEFRSLVPKTSLSGSKLINVKDPDKPQIRGPCGIAMGRAAITTSKSSSTPATLKKTGSSDENSRKKIPALQSSFDRTHAKCHENGSSLTSQDTVPTKPSSIKSRPPTPTKSTMMTSGQISPRRITGDRPLTPTKRSSTPTQASLTRQSSVDRPLTPSKFAAVSGRVSPARRSSTERTLTPTKTATVSGYKTPSRRPSTPTKISSVDRPPTPTKSTTSQSKSSRIDRPPTPTKSTASSPRRPSTPSKSSKIERPPTPTKSTAVFRRPSTPTKSFSIVEGNTGVIDQRNTPSSVKPCTSTTPGAELKRQFSETGRGFVKSGSPKTAEGKASADTTAGTAGDTGQKRYHERCHGARSGELTKSSTDAKQTKKDRTPRFV